MKPDFLHRIIPLFVFLSLTSYLSSAQTWTSDPLGAGFEMRRVDQGSDYAGRVGCTIVRFDTIVAPERGEALLYVHGFNDYFFQRELAREFGSHGYAFYAIDLRRYGRSIRPGQHPFQVRNLTEYFADIDSAINIIRTEGYNDVLLMGHSTGGLITSYYLAREDKNAEAGHVKALILNSPFLDWNLGWKECLVPMISAIGAIFPDMKIPQGKSTAYSESLMAGEHGEWHFNTDWKMPRSPDVTAGWIRAIDRAQHWLRDHPYRIDVPILLLYSGTSVEADEWTPEVNRADAVLDVKDIKRYGFLLGRRVTPVKVNGGVHDLVLSSPAVRSPLYDYMFKWLDNVKIN